VSFLDQKGRPGIVEQAFICPPEGHIGPITAEQRQAIMQSSLVAGVYEKAVDRESAYEVLKARSEQAAQAQAQPKAKSSTRTDTGGGVGGALGEILMGNGRRQGLLESMAKSAVRTIGTQLGRQILRGVMGSILGGKKRMHRLRLPHRPATSTARHVIGTATRCSRTGRTRSPTPSAPLLISIAR